MVAQPHWALLITNGLDDIYLHENANKPYILDLSRRVRGTRNHFRGTCKRALLLVALALVWTSEDACWRDASAQTKQDL